MQDNQYGTWSAWGNQYWPAKYLIDARGKVRYTHFGEGEYDQTEAAIRDLLEEAGSRSLGRSARARTEAASPGVDTPETYLGYERAERFLPELGPGTNRYRGYADLPRAISACRCLAVCPRSSGCRALRIDRLTVRGPQGLPRLSSAGGRPAAFACFSTVARQGVERGTTYARARARAPAAPLLAVSLRGVEQRRLRLELEPGISGYALRSASRG